MKTIVNITLAAALLLAAPFSAFAQEFTKGTVKKWMLPPRRSPLPMKT